MSEENKAHELLLEEAAKLSLDLVAIMITRRKERLKIDEDDYDAMKVASIENHSDKMLDRLIEITDTVLEGHQIAYDNKVAEAEHTKLEEMRNG